MKFVIRLVLIGLLSYFLPFYFPWWSIAIGSAFVGFLIHGHSFNLFNAGLLGSGLTWFYLAFSIDQKTGSIMSEKIVQLMPFDDKYLLIMGAALIGGVVSALSAATGNSLRLLFVKKKVSSGIYS